MPFGFEEAGARRYGEAIARIFAMESGEGPLPPGIVLEQDRPEWSFLKRETLWGVRLSQGAVAAVNGGVGIRNNSLDRIVVIERVFQVSAGVNCFLSGARAISLLPLPANYTLVAGGSGQLMRDSRTVGFGLDFLTKGAGGASVFDALAELVGSSALGIYDLPIVLAPKSYCILEGSGVNQAVNASFHGKIRPARPEELAD